MANIFESIIDEKNNDLTSMEDHDLLDELLEAHETLLDSETRLQVLETEEIAVEAAIDALEAQRKIMIHSLESDGLDFHTAMSIEASANHIYQTLTGIPLSASRLSLEDVDAYDSKAYTEQALEGIVDSIGKLIRKRKQITKDTWDTFTGFIRDSVFLFDRNVKNADKLLEKVHNLPTDRPNSQTFKSKPLAKYLTDKYTLESADKTVHSFVNDVLSTDIEAPWLGDVYTIAFKAHDGWEAKAEKALLGYIKRLNNNAKLGVNSVPNRTANVYGPLPGGAGLMVVDGKDDLNPDECKAYNKLTIIVGDDLHEVLSVKDMETYLRLILADKSTVAKLRKDISKIDNIVSAWLNNVVVQFSGVEGGEYFHVTRAGDRSIRTLYKLAYSQLNNLHSNILRAVKASLKTYK